MRNRQIEDLILRTKALLLTRVLALMLKNDRFGVQRMEMLAIYFAIADNITTFQSRIKKRRILKGTRKLIRRIVVSIRSDSKSTI